MVFYSRLISANSHKQSLHKTSVLTKVTLKFIVLNLMVCLSFINSSEISITLSSFNQKREVYEIFYV
jgi:hypothetical protein